MASYVVGDHLSTLSTGRGAPRNGRPRRDGERPAGVQRRHRRTAHYWQLEHWDGLSACELGRRRREAVRSRRHDACLPARGWGHNVHHPGPRSCGGPGAAGARHDGSRRPVDRRAAHRGRPRRAARPDDAAHDQRRLPRNPTPRHHAAQRRGPAAHVRGDVLPPRLADGHRTSGIPRGHKQECIGDCLRAGDGVGIPADAEVR